jgi:hypothetical protein
MSGDSRSIKAFLGDSIADPVIEVIQQAILMRF